MLYQVPERPDSPYVGSIAELLGRSAQIQADKVRDIAAIQGQLAYAQGQNKGNTIASLGQMGAQTLGGILGAKQDAKRKAALDQYLQGSDPITIGGLMAHGASSKEADTLYKTLQADDTRQRAAEVQDRNYKLEQDKFAFEQKRLAASDAQTAQTRREGLANQVVNELTPGQTLSPPSANTLETGGRADLVKTNPPQAMPAFLQTPETAPDYVPGAQPGKVFTGTAAQNFQRQQAEQTAERQRQTDARLDKQAAEGNRHNLAMEAAARLRAGNSPNASADVKDTIAGMREGTLPPLLPGRASKEYIALMAEAKRQGFDLAGAATDWQATQKHISTLNGAQQTRMRQAVDNSYHSLDVIEDLAKQWDGGKFPVLNHMALRAAKNGAFGEKAQQIATNLEAQISDVTSELGNVYMGGNSPTDHALSLAGKNLSADWTKGQLISAIGLARTNLKIRQNSMNNVGVAGASADNPYAPPPPAAPAQAAPSAPKTGERRTANGQTAEWDGKGWKLVTP